MSADRTVVFHRAVRSNLGLVGSGGFDRAAVPVQPVRLDILQTARSTRSSTRSDQVDRKSYHAVSQNAPEGSEKERSTPISENFAHPLPPTPIDGRHVKKQAQ